MVDFIPPESQLLTREAREVPIEEITSEHIRRLCDELLGFAAGLATPDGKTGKKLVGLAANQVGIDLAIAAVNLAVPGNWGDEMRVLINPRIVRQWGEDELVKWWHGCYSTDELITVIYLPRFMEVEYYDRQGNKQSWVIDGKEHGARLLHVVWHEVRHLHGLRHIDKAVEENWPIYVVSDERREKFYARFLANIESSWRLRLRPEGWTELVAGRPWRQHIYDLAA